MKHEAFIQLIKRIVQTTEYGKDSTEVDRKEIEELLEIATKEKNADKYLWLAGWSFGSVKAAIRKFESIRKLADELYEASSKLYLDDTEIDFEASKFNASISDTVTSATESYRAHEEYSRNDDAEKLYEGVEHIRDAIKSAADALELLGCKREASNVRSALEHGVKP